MPAANVTFQAEDCQHTSLREGTFDAAFISLVIHFTEPGRTVVEMHRILGPGGTLIIANLDPLGELLGRSGFRVESSEAVRDSSRSSNIPVEYVRAAKA